MKLTSKQSNQDGMTEQQILKKAIQKAIDGNFDMNIGEAAIVMLPQVFGESIDARNLWIWGFIFNHNFAKALWGEYTETMIVQNNTLNVKQVIDMDGWRYHITRMVLAEDPIKYLGAHLND